MIPFSFAGGCPRALYLAAGRSPTAVARPGLLLRTPAGRCRRGWLSPWAPKRGSPRAWQLNALQPPGRCCAPRRSALLVMTEVARRRCAERGCELRRPRRQNRGPVRRHAGSARQLIRLARVTGVLFHRRGLLRSRASQCVVPRCHCQRVNENARRFVAPAGAVSRIYMTQVNRRARCAVR